MGALCRALQGRHTEATELLTELAEACRPVTMLFSGEWSAAVATAAALCGRGAAKLVHDMISKPQHLTPWGRAALRTVSAAIADADGDHRRAATELTAVAEVYAGIPATTDRMLTLALSVGALTRAGNSTGAARLRAEVRRLAHRDRAPGLLRLTEPTVPRLTGCTHLTGCPIWSTDSWSPRRSPGSRPGRWRSAGWHRPG